MFQKLYSDKKTLTCIKLDEMFSLKYLICNPKTKFGTCLFIDYQHRQRLHCYSTDFDPSKAHGQWHAKVL